MSAHTWNDATIGASQVCAGLDCRDEVATWMSGMSLIAARINPDDQQYIKRHADVTVTDLYQHAYRNDLIIEINKIVCPRETIHSSLKKL